jgi:hypothetical protein
MPIIKREALLEVLPTRGEFPEAEADEAFGIAADELRDDVAGGVAQLSELGGKPLRALQVGSSPRIRRSDLPTPSWRRSINSS